jgi:sterol desaturase/sphingolipid hydroxylase (fatty acid hydroxylase superfamily)
MRKLLKVLLPVLIDFGIFWGVIKYYTPDHPMKLVEIGNGNLYSLMAYFHLFWSLLLAVGILTQYLVIVPLWDNQAVKSLKARVIIGVCIAIVCFAFAGSISYIIWDPADGREPLLSFWWYLSEIQLFYWVFTFVVLYLIDGKKFVRAKAPEEIESPV